MADTSQKRAFLDFLDQHDGMRHVDAMLKQGASRLPLSLDELRAFDAETARALVARPADYLPAFEDALRELRR